LLFKRTSKKLGIVDVAEFFQSLLSVMPALTGGFVVSRVWSLASPVFGHRDHGVFNAVTATLQVPRQFLNPVVLCFVRYPSLLCRFVLFLAASARSRLASTPEEAAARCTVDERELLQRHVHPFVERAL